MASYYSALRSTRKFGISIDFLKTLAMLSMLLDHIGVMLIRNGKLYGYSPEYYQMAIETAEGRWWLRLSELCIYAGRLAFPLFCFILVEGFIHTRDLKRYIVRMLIFALVSELPFDLAFYNANYDFSGQNVGFTMLIGLLVMYGMRRFRRRTELKWLCVLAGMFAAEQLRVDYGALGVLLIVLLYNFRKEKLLQLGSGAVLASVLSYTKFLTAALAFVPVYFYNGERGWLRWKYFPYIFYPLHLSIMYAMVYIGSRL